MESSEPAPNGVSPAVGRRPAVTGPRTGAPLAAGIVAALFAVGLAAWIAATIALVLAAGDLAQARPFAGPVVLAVHLVTVAVLPCAVSAATLHLLPVLLRNDLRRPGTLRLLPLLLGGGFLTAAGLGRDLAWLTWPGIAFVGLGLILVVWQLLGLIAAAPRGRMIVASRVGVGLVCLHATAALVLGAVIYARGDRSLAGVPHARLVLIHLHLAVVGWLALLIITVGRTLVPMLAMAPAAPRRAFPADELCLTAGLWLLVAGIALPAAGLEAVGAAAIVAALARFALVAARAFRRRRARPVEAPLGHVLIGVACVAQAAVVGAITLTGTVGSDRGAEVYVLLILAGWAAGITVGHAGKLMSLSIWASWPPGPRPKQHRLYPRRLWQAEAILFAVAIEALAVAILLGASTAARVAAATLTVSAVAAFAATAQSWRHRQRQPA